MRHLCPSLVGYAAGEEVVLRVATEVDQGQRGNGRPLDGHDALGADRRYRRGAGEEPAADGQRLEACSDVHPIAENVFVLVRDVADMDRLTNTVSMLLDT